MEHLVALERNSDYFNVTPFKSRKLVEIEHDNDYSIRVNESKCTANVSYQGTTIAKINNECLTELIVSAYEAVDNHADAVVMDMGLHRIVE